MEICREHLGQRGRLRALHWALEPPRRAGVRHLASSAPRASRWLDVGCGTGALSATILSLGSPSSVTSVDSSAGFVSYARERISDESVQFTVCDAQRLPFADTRFDATVAGLVLNFLPEPGRGLAEMVRTVRPSGVVAVYVWDYPARCS